MDVSIIIPTHNRPQHLAHVISSVAENFSEISTFELVIIDDASDRDYRDAYLALITKWQTQGVSIKYIFNDFKSNPGQCRNQAAKLACGKYLYFIDDDCFFLHDNAQIICNLFDKYDTEMVSGPIENGSNRWSALQNLRTNFYSYYRYQEGRSFLSKVFKKEKTYFVSFAPTLNLVIRADCFNQHTFLEDLDVCEDLEFCQRIGESILYSEELSIGHDHPYNDFSELLSRLKTFDSYSKSYPGMKSYIYNGALALLACLHYRSIKLLLPFLRMNFSKSKEKKPFNQTRKAG